MADSLHKEPWYLKWWTVVVLLLTIGPFAFPLLWKSKDFNLFWKIFLTVLFLALTVALSWGTLEIVKTVIKQFKDLGLL